jgi:hypothetical protein
LKVLLNVQGQWLIRARVWVSSCTINKVRESSTMSSRDIMFRAYAAPACEVRVPPLAIIGLMNASHKVVIETSSIG